MICPNLGQIWTSMSLVAKQKYDYETSIIRQRKFYLKQMKSWIEGLCYSLTMQIDIWKREVENMDTMKPLVVYHIPSNGDYWIEGNPTSDFSAASLARFPFNLDVKILAKEVCRCSERCGSAYIKKRIEDGYLNGFSLCLSGGLSSDKKEYLINMYLERKRKWWDL